MNAAPLADDIRFPPLITPVRLRERADAFDEAIRQAPEAGAGTLFYVGRFELIEFALVLEPEEPLRIARQIAFAGMRALAEALSVLSPPEKDIRIRYPGSLYFDSALVGGGRLGIPEGAREDEPPDWLVFGAMVRAGGMRESGIGIGPEITTLDDEGFEAWEPASFAASFARHFLVEADSWGEQGMAGIGPRYLAQLDGREPGARYALDGSGNLVVRRETGETRTAFAPALARAEWFDPLLNGPRG